ncbi:hypothetical protein EVAR_44721_1 [Eumeta japonica]|uniref:Uncharacterized protein n=1 Tax=Eumeta variegata TaxID=151549 RepID=A0A4C1XKX2_EUMVA|nr:hypothetical protein EVAR_44721_1 [Eumeta japonica]
MLVSGTKQETFRSVKANKRSVTTLRTSECAVERIFYMYLDTLVIWFLRCEQTETETDPSRPNHSVKSDGKLRSLDLALSTLSRSGLEATNDRHHECGNNVLDRGLTDVY